MASELVEVPESSGFVAMEPLIFSGAVSATYDGSKAVNINIPVGAASGSSSGNTFSMTLTLAEAVNSFTVTLPCNLRKLLIGNFHFNIPGLTTAMTLYASFGGATKNFGAINASSETNASGANLYLLKHFGNIFAASFTAAANYPNNARPGNIGMSVAYGNSTDIQFYSNTAGVTFTAGTEITIWGLYEV